MEEDDTIIIQVIFKFEDGRLYNFDVDYTTTFYETKKILSNAAHIFSKILSLFIMKVKNILQNMTNNLYKKYFLP